MEEREIEIGANFIISVMLLHDLAYGEIMDWMLYLDSEMILDDMWIIIKNSK